MGPHVRGQVAAVGAAVAAVLAREGLHTSVRPDVPRQPVARHVPERAQMARVALDPGVPQHVSLEDARPRGAIVAQPAGERLFPGMLPRMIQHVTLALALEVAAIARERSLTSVGPEMQRQTALQNTSVRTILTGEVLLTGVPFQVRSQPVGRFEFALAIRTCVRLLAGVSPHVSDEGVFLGALVLADVTDELPLSRVRQHVVLQTSFPLEARVAQVAVERPLVHVNLGVTS